MSRCMRYLLLQSALLLSVAVCAQDYIVTIQGDTITGEVKPLTFGPDKRVQVTEPGKKKVVYPFFKVKAFKVDEDIYQPVKGPQGYTFMKLIKPGFLSLYTFQSPNQNLYDGQFLVKRTGDGIEVPNITFKKGMRRFLDDCPDVAEKIENDQLNKKDLYQIIDEYNACMQNQIADTRKVVEAKAAATKAIDHWNNLESKVKSQPDFPEKKNALEMIAEIKSKINSSQKIPNFLIEGLKSTLNDQDLDDELDSALQALN